MLFLQCLNKENCYLGISLFFLMLSLLYWAYPGSSDGKESAFNVGDLGLISGLGRSPGEGNSYTLQYCCLENSKDRGALEAYNPWGCRFRYDWATFPSLHFIMPTPLEIYCAPESIIVQR